MAKLSCEQTKLRTKVFEGLSKCTIPECSRLLNKSIFSRLWPFNLLFLLVKGLRILRMDLRTGMIRSNF